ncbi:MAG: hypothetical protein ACO38P_07105 [Phycisphaerales bacterium]
MRGRDRRERLQSLLDLVRAMRGWSRAELSAALGRDPTKLVPASGNPKLDLVLRLAQVMEWSPGEVLEAIGGEPASEVWNTSVAEQCVPEDLDELATYLETARRERRWDVLRAAGAALRRDTEDPDRRALADHLIASAWAGMGCFSCSLAAAQRGLSQSGLHFGTRSLLILDAAAAHYALWNLVESHAIATDLLLSLERRSAADDRLSRLIVASVRSIRGQARRRLAAEEGEQGEPHAEAACEDLAAAEREFRWLHEDYLDPADLARAHICRGGWLECRARLDGSVRRVLEAIVAGLDEIVEIDRVTDSDLLEAHGWWCVFGANIALQMGDDPTVQQPMAILTNKCFEIADRLDHWAMRERSFTLEHFRRQRAWGGRDEFDQWVLDAEDLRVLMGTMGRFPRFREVGWRIISLAGFVDG